MKLDRELQRKILEELAEAHPQSVIPKCIKGINDHRTASNLVYLEDLGLITKAVAVGLSGNFLIHGTRISAKGMDFLADDGGLSAILGTVTVRFHEDTLRALIEKKVEDNPDLTSEDKSALIVQLRALPGEAIKHLSMKLLDKGLEHLPGAVGLIQTSLSNLGSS